MLLATDTNTRVYNFICILTKSLILKSLMGGELSLTRLLENCKPDSLIEELRKISWETVY